MIRYSISHHTRAFFSLLLIISFWLPSSALAQRVVPNLSKWIVTTPPKPQSQGWYAANQSDFEWKVSLRNGKVVVRAFDEAEPRQKTGLPFSPRPTTIATIGRKFFTHVNDGWIIGFNAGEWGGSLWWYSPRGDKHYLISNDQVEGFFPTRAGLLALEGLAHMGLNDGQIIQIRQAANGRWKSTRFVALKHAPEAATQEKDGSLLVATTDRLLRVHLDKRVEVLLTSAAWGGLYPNSVVETPSKEIYLGMRHGVARVRWLHGKFKVDWLLPNRAFVNAKPKF